MRITLLVFFVVVLGGAIYLLVRPGSTKPVVIKPSTPVAPPTPIAVVTEIGTGPALGNGANALIIDLGQIAKSHEHLVGVGTFPDAVAISPTRATAYVTNYASGTVTPIDLASGRPGRPIAAGSGPAEIAIAPDGKTAYVTDAGSAPLGDTVTPIDLRTDRPLRTIRVGLGPQGIAITPDGTRAYVANAGAIVTGQTGAIGHTVTPINLITHRALAPINVGNAPIAVAVNGDGSTVFVTNSYSGSVSPISVASDTAGTPIEMSGSPQAIASVPGRGEILVANAATSGTDNLTTISVVTESVKSSIAVPKNPTAVAVSPDGKTAWLVSLGTGALLRIDLVTGVVDSQHEIAIPDGPYALAVGSIPGSDATKLFHAATSRKAKSKKSTK